MKVFIVLVGTAACGFLVGALVATWNQPAQQHPSLVAHLDDKAGIAAEDEQSSETQPVEAGFYLSKSLTGLPPTCRLRS